MSAFEPQYCKNKSILWQVLLGQERNEAKIPIDIVYISSLLNSRLLQLLDFLLQTIYLTPKNYD